MHGMSVFSDLLVGFATRYLSRIRVWGARLSGGSGVDNQMQAGESRRIEIPVWLRWGATSYRVFNEGTADSFGW